MINDIKKSLSVLAIFFFLFAISYPLVTTIITTIVVPAKANGSLVYDADNKIIGSELIGQNFTQDKYFWGRNSYADKKVGDPPIDLITKSASGVDPDISPAAALYQVARISAARKISTEKIEAIITKYTKQRTFGIFGEARVNLLALNRALDLE